MFSIRITSDVGSILRQFQKEDAQYTEERSRIAKEQLESDILSLAGSKRQLLSEEAKAKQEQFKQIQTQEQEQQAILQANKSALAAAGLGEFRKRRKTSDGNALPLGKSDLSLPTTTQQSILPPSSVVTRQSRYENRRITLLDFIYLLEKDSRLSRTPLMYLTYYRLAKRY